jgi:sigma-E factor negative regulatory protein RseC
MSVEPVLVSISRSFTEEKNMADEKARVIDAGEDGWARVVIEKSEACHHCEASQFCHSLTDCSRVTTRVLNRVGAGEGDMVTIHVSSQTVLKGAFLLWVIPTIGLLLGAAAGLGLSRELGLGETGLTFVGTFAGLVLGFGLTAVFSKRITAGNRLTPVITRIIKPNVKTLQAKKRSEKLNSHESCAHGI